MNKTLISLIFFCLCNMTFAQVVKKEENAFIRNESSTDKEFRQILNLQFSKIITGSNFSTFGNYASIKTIDETLSFSASILRKNGNVLTLKSSGGATEGVSGFFDNGKLNTNISGELTYHIFINPFSNTSIKRNSFERDKLRAEFQKTEDTYRADTIANNHKKELLDLKIKIEKFKTKKVNINNSLKTVLSQLEINESEKLQMKKDSLSYENEKNELDLNIVERQKKEFDSEEYFLVAREKIDQAFDIATKDNNSKVVNQAIGAINIYWLSFGYGIRNDGFKLFDSTLNFSDQIQKKKSLTQTFNIAISHYNWDIVKSSTFWSAGTSFKIGNNLTSLDNIKVKDFEDISNNPNRQAYSEQSVYKGIFSDNLKELTLFFDYYKFFKVSESNNVAIHLKPVLLIKENNKPNSSLWTGIVLPFKKADDISSFVNLEILYCLKDIFNTSGSENSLIARNTIGLSATFPINFHQPKTN